MDKRVAKRNDARIVCRRKGLHILLRLASHLAKFNLMDSPILVSAEACCSPRLWSWSKRFPKQASGRHWLNSGVWMGNRESVATMLNAMHVLARRLLRSGWADMPMLRGYRRYVRNDQFLWQACYLYPELVPGGQRIRLDANFDCFANIACEDRRIRNNTTFHFLGNHVVVKANGATPGVLHFSSAADAVMERWREYLVWRVQQSMGNSQRRWQQSLREFCALFARPMAWTLGAYGEPKNARPSGRQRLIERRPMCGRWNLMFGRTFRQSIDKYGQAQL